MIMTLKNIQPFWVGSSQRFLCPKFRWGSLTVNSFGVFKSGKTCGDAMFKPDRVLNPVRFIPDV